MNKKHLSLLFSSAILSLNSFAQENLINTDLMQKYCKSNYGTYFNCDYNSLINRPITNTKEFTLPMTFTVFYSKSQCGTHYDNGAFQISTFNLKIGTNGEIKSFINGNARTKLHGKTLQFFDLDPWITKNITYYQPCSLSIRKIEIDFSIDAKKQIESLISLKMKSGMPPQLRDLIKVNITQLTDSLSVSNIPNAKANLNDLIQKFEEGAEYNLLEQNQKQVLTSVFQKLNTANMNRDNSKLAEHISKSIESIIKSVREKLERNLSQTPYETVHNVNIQLQAIRYEAEREPYFNKTSLETFKNQIK